MFVESKLHISHDQLTLVPSLQDLDQVKMRVIIQCNTNPNTADFPFLIEYDDRLELEGTFNNDPTVSDYELVKWGEERGIYYIENSNRTKHISNIVTAVNGFLTHMETEEDGWFLQMYLPSRSALSTIWECANENDIDLDISEIHNRELYDVISNYGDYYGFKASYGLTEEQKSALEIAHKEGYFQTPRNTSLSEVADEMGLSSTAMNGRLRRGIRNLVDTTISKEGSQD